MAGSDRRGWPPRNRLTAVLLVVLAVPVAAAHGAGDAAWEERDGNLLIGGYDAAQPGPLVIVPASSGALSCDPVPGTPRLDLGNGNAVNIAANATHVAAAFDLADDAFAAFGLDTHTASRALLAMQEHAVARHRVGAVLWAGEGNLTGPRGGELGVPYRLGSAVDGAPAAHGETGEVAGIAYGPLGVEGPVMACEGSAGHVTLLVPRDGAGVPAGPGSVLHMVALHDGVVVDWLPYALPSTKVVQANLYFARPGEDPAALAAAFEPAWGAQEWLPVGALALGLVLVVRPARRSAG